VDRFLYKILITYPSFDDEVKILGQNITTHEFSDYSLQPVLSQMDIMDAQKFVKKIYTNPKIERYIIRLVDATRNPEKYGLAHAKYLQYGVSPRAGISLYIASKAHALIKGRGYVTPDDVKEVAYNVMRHRVMLNFEGEAEEIKPEAIIKEILEKVPIL
jgi:MoxR-like ATPase